MFEDALEKVLKREGGYVDHPDDRGGATNYGITIKTLGAHLGRKATKEEVKNLDMEVVEEIYLKNYWDPLRLDFVDDPRLQSMLFDQAVNRGPDRVIRQWQEVIEVGVDGRVGPITLSKTNSLKAEKVMLDFIKATQISYAKIVRNDHSQAVFIVGWINRTHELLDMI